MPVVLIAGPEKSGKTTLCRDIQLHEDVDYRHWGPVPSWQTWLQPLVDDVRSPRVALWDRGWICDVVYSRLLGRRAHFEDAWQAEWLLGRAIRSLGAKLALLGPNHRVLQSRRDSSDLPVEPRLEQEEYSRYASLFPDWKSYHQADTYDIESVFDTVHMLQAIGESYTPETPLPPQVVGKLDSPVLILGERRNVHELSHPGLPFSSPYTTKFGRLFGSDAFDIAWSNAEECPASFLCGKTVVACGAAAARWAEAHLGSRKDLLTTYHPAWTFRYRRREAQSIYGPIVTEVRALLASAREEVISAPERRLA